MMFRCHGDNKDVNDDDDDEDDDAVEALGRQLENNNKEKRDIFMRGK